MAVQHQIQRQPLLTSAPSHGFFAIQVGGKQKECQANDSIGSHQLPSIAIGFGDNAAKLEHCNRFGV